MEVLGIEGLSKIFCSFLRRYTNLCFTLTKNKVLSDESTLFFVNVLLF